MVHALVMPPTLGVSCAPDQDAPGSVRWSGGDRKGRQSLTQYVPRIGEVMVS